MGEIETSAYVRMSATDQPGVLGRIATVLGREGVSIESVIQKPAGDDVADIVWVMHKGPERHLQAALSAIEELDVVEQICSVIRVVDE